MSKLKISEVMHRQAITWKLSESSDVFTDCQILRQHQLRDLPIVDAGDRARIAFTHKSDGSCTCLDEKLLQPILSNLLSNAIKYFPRGSTVWFSVICEKDRAIFPIQDRGIGIPKKDRMRLFESFHRATNVGHTQGTGSGPSLVKNFIDLHGGQITVASQVGVGTTFTVTLPTSLSESWTGE